MKFKVRTALGVDLMIFRDIAALPDVALSGLGGVFLEIVRTLSLPLQTMLSLLVLLAIKQGGGLLQQAGKEKPIKKLIQ